MFFFCFVSWRADHVLSIAHILWMNTHVPGLAGSRALAVAAASPGSQCEEPHIDTADRGLA